MNKRLTAVQQMLIDDKANRKIVCTATYSVLGLVALVMTAMNIITHKGFLTWSTGVFAALCILNLLLVYRGAAAMQASMILFALEIVVLFTYFLISGNPEGFSAIWVCMLPSVGMFFFGRKNGSLLCVAMLGILAFCLWTKIGNSFLMYDYTDSFKMRFPVLFASFFCMAFFLETLRRLTYLEMSRLQVLYKEQSIRDALTGVYNRQGLYTVLASDDAFQRHETLGIIMFDIDFFKSFNDSYGHETGDYVLSSFAQLIEKELNAVVCRWGGEEFVAAFCDDNVSLDDAEKLCEKIASTCFVPDRPELKVTASIGICTEKGLPVQDIEQLIVRADELLYKAKNSGRNQVVCG